MFFRSWGAKLGAVALGLVLWMHAVTEQSFDREVMVRLLIEDPELPPETKRPWGRKIRMSDDIIEKVTRDWQEYGLPGSGDPIWKRNTDD